MVLNFLYFYLKTAQDETELGQKVRKAFCFLAVTVEGNYGNFSEGFSVAVWSS